MILLATVAFAESMTLEQAMTLSASRPATEAVGHGVRAVRRDATTAWLGATGPVIGGSANAWRRSDELAIETPVGPFVQQPDRQTQAGARVSLPIVAVSDLVNAAAADKAVRAAENSADRRRQELALQAADAFLDVVVLDARRDAVAGFVSALETRLEQANAQREAGVVLPSDALRVEVALADARQQQLALVRGREIAALSLGWTVGRTEAVEPVFAYDPPATDVDVDVAVDARPDLAALDAQLKALRLQRAAVATEALPRLDAYGAYSWTDREGLVANDWTEAGLELTWTLGARGTRVSRSAALGARIAELEAQRRDADLAVRLEIASAEADRDVATAEVAVRELAVRQATEAARILSDSYGAGESVLIDALQADAELRDQRARLAVSRAESVRTDLRLQLAAGML